MRPAPRDHPIGTPVRRASLKIEKTTASKAGDPLRRLDLPVELVATSDEWGVAKPAPEFFDRVIDSTV